MRIVLATPIYPPEIGGPATYTKEIAERLRKQHHITVVAYANTAEKIEGTTLITINKNRPLPIRLIQYALALWGASKDADIIYVQNAMAAGLPATIVGMFRRVPVVLKFVGDEAWERASGGHLTNKRLEEFLSAPEGGFRVWLMMRIQGFVLRHAALVTTPSAYLKDALIRTYRVAPERAVTNYNAAEETETAPFPVKQKPHQIVTTARLTAWKGIDGIIRAVKLLKEKYPDVHLVVAGDGPEMENLKTLVQKLGVEKEVELLGRISRAQTWQLRKNSEVYVLNSTYEGLPHTVLTSFAAEIPTIATDIPGTNEAAYDEVSGLLVSPENPQALANAVERLFEDKALQKRLVEGGKKILEEKFSWGAHLRNLLSLFQSALAKPRD